MAGALHTFGQANPDSEPDRPGHYHREGRRPGATDFPAFLAMEAIGYRCAGIAVPERPDVRGKGFAIAVIDSGVSKDDWLRDVNSGCTR